MYISNLMGVPQSLPLLLLGPLQSVSFFNMFACKSPYPFRKSHSCPCSYCGTWKLPAGCGAGFSPPNLVFLEESLQRGKPVPLHYFSVSNGLHTRTKIQRVKAKSKQKHFPQYNYNPFLWFLTKKKKKVQIETFSSLWL